MPKATQLLFNRFDNVRMTMTDRNGNNTTETIQILSAIGIVQVLHPTLMDQ